MFRRHRWLQYVLLISAGTIVFLVVHTYRYNPRMNEDYQKANSPLPSVAAVEDLAKFQDTRAASLLLKIAQNPDAFPQNREFAILALAKRGNGTITDSLAELLRPGEALDIQLAIVGLLLDRECQRQCIRYLVLYFERLYNGELMPHPMSVNPDVNQNFENTRQGILRLSKEVLRKNKIGTIESLRDKYGLGTAKPTPFVLQLLKDLDMVEACPSLMQTEDLARKSGMPLLPDIQSVVDSLQCRRRTTSDSR